MPGITLNTTFTGAGLPVAASLADQIAAIPGLKCWAQFDPAYAVLDGGAIASLTCRAGTGVKFAQSVAARRASMVAGALGQFSAGLFAGNDGVADGALDFYEPTGLVHAANTPFTLAAVVKPTLNTSNDLILSRYTSSSARVLLQIAAGQASVSIGAGAPRNLAGVRIGDWNVIIGSWDGAILRLHLNGVESSGPAVSDTGSADWRIGALNATAPGGFGFDGLIADAMIFDSDVLSNIAHRAVLLEYFSTVYGL